MRRNGAMKLRYRLYLCVFAIILASFDAAQAEDVSPQTQQLDLKPDIAKWSPELVGGQWGWRLEKYKALEAIYHIGGRTLLLLSTDTTFVDNVLWDPLTGAGKHLDGNEYAIFYNSNGKNLARSIVFGELSISDGRTLTIQSSPGVMWSCSPNFENYFEIFDMHRQLLRSFYIVKKLLHPMLIWNHRCTAGGTIITKQKVHFEFGSGVIDYADLPDSTILFLGMDEAGLTIVRLDKNLQQHTSLGNSIFALNAIDINDTLRSSQWLEDPQFRYKIFMRAITATQKPTLP